jgi:hypothetical protein
MWEGGEQFCSVLWRCFVDHRLSKKKLSPFLYLPEFFAPAGGEFGWRALSPKKMLTWMVVRYTFMSAIHSGGLQGVTVTAHLTFSCISFEQRLIG